MVILLLPGRCSVGGSDAVNAVEVRCSTRQGLLEATTGLVAELAGPLMAGTVIGCVARARERLLGYGVRSGLAVAAESMARLRLSGLLPAHRSAG